MIKTILAATIYEADLETLEPARHVIDFALELATQHAAHLSIAVGACRLSAPSVVTIAEARGLIAKANEERASHARAFGEDVLRVATPTGVSASSHVIHGDFQALGVGLLALARTSDITVMQPSDAALSIGQGVLEEIIFNSGRPVLVVPPGSAARFGRVVVAWDGSAKAARAIGDAMPFIEGADDVEIVTVAGDRNRSKQIEGADLAPHISRHARKVRLTTLASPDGDIAKTIGEHAAMTRTGLLVMGAYGHSRLREFILGGVTRAMIQTPPVPVLMSY